MPVAVDLMALVGLSPLIQVAEGKTKAARRFLPMVPEVYAFFVALLDAMNIPKESIDRRLQRD
ncbi:MAG TPA: hypothetical protein VJV22_19250 [Acidobacteriaceae bacterium]|nr:hypothetical protein [Acidobacteriaceae bacterium]